MGVLSLPNLTTIGGSRREVLASGSGSEIDLPALTSFSVAYNGYLSVTNQATLIASNLTVFANVTITTDPTATFTVPANQTFSFPSGTTTINTGTLLDQGNLDLGRTEVFTLANYPGGGTGIIQTPQPVQSQLLRHPGEYHRPDDRLIR